MPLRPFDPGPVPAISPRPTARAYPDGGPIKELLEKTIAGPDFSTGGAERTLLTTNAAWSAIDVYMVGGGPSNPATPHDYTLYAFNGGVRAVVARCRLFGSEHGPGPSDDQARVAGPTFLFSGRVACEKYEVAYVCDAGAFTPGSALPKSMTVSAMASNSASELAEFQGTYYPFRGTGLFRYLKQERTTNTEVIGIDRQLLKAAGINLTNEVRIFEVWGDSNFNNPGRVWSVCIPPNGGFDFALPANPAVDGLNMQTGDGLTIRIGKVDGTIANNGDVRWNILAR